MTCCVKRMMGQESLWSYRKENRIGMQKELDDDVLEGMYFCLKNMTALNHRPQVLTHGIFDKIFWITEFLKMDEETRTSTKLSMTTERDLKNQFAYARKEGREEGLEEVAKRMLTCGMKIEQIAELTQLSIDRIKTLH